MPDPMEERSLLEMLDREEKKSRDRKIAEESETLKRKLAERLDWWTEKDLLTDPLSERPVGFLANDELLCRGTLWMMFGDGGSFKTFLMMYLLSRIATGSDFVGTKTRKGRCLLLSEEMPRPQIKKRVGTLWSPEEIEERDGQMAYRFHDPDSPLDFYSEPDKSKKRLCNYIENSNDPDVVAIDHLVKIHTGDERNNSHGAIVLNSLSDVAIKMNVPLGLIHHTGKKNEFRQGSDRARGWSCTRDIVADMMLVDKIGPDEMPLSRVSWTKTRDLSKPILPFTFTLERDRVNPEKSAFVFGRTDQSDTSVKPKDIDLMVDLVLELGGFDGEVLRDALLNTIRDRWKWGRNRFEACLSECVRSGKIERVTRGKEASFFIPRGERKGER